MNCIVMYQYRGIDCMYLAREVTQENWFETFRSQNSYDKIISHMFIG